MTDRFLLVFLAIVGTIVLAIATYSLSCNDLSSPRQESEDIW